MRSSSSHRSRALIRPAFSKTEVIVIIVVVVVFCSIVLICGLAGIMLPALGKARQSARQLKDSTQVRGAMQSMIVWGSNMKGSYPLPSAIDLKNTTVAELDEAKNTTGNILSLLVFNGNISPEICVSPAESNPQIQRYDAYEYSNPAAAVKPADAYWDPAFRGTPDDAAKGRTSGAHQSYAHLLPFGNRRAQWKDTYSGTEAAFGNRGPTYAANDVAKSSAVWTLLPGPTGANSNTLLIHGGRTTWEGNIGYNDNHVNFETKPAPAGIKFPIGPPPAKGKASPPQPTAPDNLFVNESDEYQGDAAGKVDSGTNAYLRPVSQVTNPASPNVWRD